MNTDEVNIIDTSKQQQEKDKTKNLKEVLDQSDK